MKSLTLREQAYLKIRKLILSGELQQGRFLTERELTEMLGMSRTPIRSALVKLEAEGIIINTPNKGPMVAEISLNKAIEIYDLRLALESHVIKQLSSSNILEKDKVDLYHILDEQKNAIKNDQLIRFTELDSEFHRKLVMIYQNEEIMKAFERIQNQLTLFLSKVFQASPNDLTLYYEEHVKITEQLISQKTEECLNSLIEHLKFDRYLKFKPSNQKPVHKKPVHI